MNQITQDRDQLTRAREEMLMEQRKIISECFEEKRKIEADRAKLSALKKETVDMTRTDRSSAMMV